MACHIVHKLFFVTSCSCSTELTINVLSGSNKISFSPNELNSSKSYPHIEPYNIYSVPDLLPYSFCKNLYAVSLSFEVEVNPQNVLYSFFSRLTIWLIALKKFSEEEAKYFGNFLNDFNNI